VKKKFRTVLYNMINEVVCHSKNTSAQKKFREDKKMARVKKVWNEDVKTYVQENASTMTDKRLSQTLSEKNGSVFTVSDVRAVRRELGIKKARGRGCTVVSQ